MSDMEEVTFEIRGVTAPMLGFCVVVGIDDEGEQVQQIAAFGDPRLWTLLGLAEAASEEFRMQLRDMYRDVQDEDEGN